MSGQAESDLISFFTFIPGAETYLMRLVYLHPRRSSFSKSLRERSTHLPHRPTSRPRGSTHSLVRGEPKILTTEGGTAVARGIKEGREGERRKREHMVIENGVCWGWVCRPNPVKYPSGIRVNHVLRRTVPFVPCDVPKRNKWSTGRWPRVATLRSPKGFVLYDRALFPIHYLGDELKSQDSLLKKLDVTATAREKGSAISGRTTSDSLTTLINVVDLYEAKIGQTRSANQALRTVAHEIDRDGLQGVEGRGVEIRSWVELLLSAVRPSI